MRLDEIRRLVSHYTGRGVRFEGAYGSWEEASAQAKGYSDKDVLSSAIAANQEVLAGRAAYERDGVAFGKPDYPFALISCLFRIALSNERLSIADFGGGLASTYYQCRLFLSTVSKMQWGVVEQKGFVDWGAANLQSDRLSFHSDIPAVMEAIAPNTVLLSGVLQYLPDPYAILSEFAAAPTVKYIIFDRTPMLADAGRSSELAVQRVPASVVASSYPAWLFSRDELLNPLLRAGFHVGIEWDALDLPMGSLKRKVVFKGLMLEKSRNE